MRFFIFAVIVLLSSLFSGCSSDGSLHLISTSYATAKKPLKAFRSEHELKSYLKKLVKKRAPRGGGGGGGKSDDFQMDGLSTTVEVSAAPVPNEESITNVQHVGVDEGGIVKLHGDHLVVLRRGRLFTLKIGAGELRPISSANAFGPDMDPDGAWYDEMLISDGTIAVIGYSYERGGTEIGLFQIDGSGRLKYRSTYHLRSNDYYSSRNYASRLIGQKLIFYSALNLDLSGNEDVMDSFPAIRRWHTGAKENEFRRITPAARVYQGLQNVDKDDYLALHTITTCSIASGEMSCEAEGVIGNSGNVFYVSNNSVYVWTSDWQETKHPSMLYRMPLDGSAPGALATSGSPVDQFSFLEGKDGHLNVLVRDESAGDAMWSAERAEGEVALMRVAVTDFADGSVSVPLSQYRRLLKPAGYSFQNRFVGDHLLYGTGSGWGAPDKNARSILYITRLDGNGVTQLPMPHGIDRIDALGSDAIAIGTDGNDLHFTSVRLGNEPTIADRYKLKGSSQGETRSHGFFYKPADADTGVLGLPVRGPGRPGFEHLFDDSASVVFLKNESLVLTEMGSLVSKPEGAADDGCKASCVDWYGNARPLFIHGRVFALLGYEVVEGRIVDRRISEIRRASFAPVAVKRGDE